MEKTSDKNQEEIYKLREQISFLEARIARYEELVNGPSWHRWVFGGKNVWAWIAGCILSVIAALVVITHYRSFFWIPLLFCGGIFLYCWIHLNHTKKVNSKARFEKMVASLKKEKVIQDQKLADLKAEAATVDGRIRADDTI